MTKPTPLMGDRWKDSFYRFLTDEYKKDDSPIGDLARAAQVDPYFPKRSHNLSAIRRYLENEDYPQDQIDALEEAFRNYMDELYQMMKEDNQE